ncbi:unnamed protein product, partial [Musa textilis]
LADGQLPDLLGRAPDVDEPVVELAADLLLDVQLERRVEAAVGDVHVAGEAELGDLDADLQCL